MAQVSTRVQLAEYCLRALGFPVIKIEIDEEQLDDRIQDAIDFMVDYNYNLQEKKYLPIKVTQLMIDNNYVNVPEEILAVSRIMPINNPNINNSNYLFDIQYHLTANDILTTMGTGDISGYYITKQHLATVQDLFNAKSQHEFRRYTDKLYFKFKAEQRLSVDDFIVLECTTAIDTASRFYGDRNLRKYATALVKRQWASNISKYQNVELPGGVKLSGTELYNQAQAELDKMENDPNFLYSEPLEFAVG